MCMFCQDGIVGKVADTCIANPLTVNSATDNFPYLFAFTSSDVTSLWSWWFLFIPFYCYVWLTVLSGGKRGDYQNCSVLYCVLKLRTVISTLRWAVLTVLWIGFCHTGPISLCVDLLLFICILCFLFHMAYVFYYCEHRGVDLMGLQPNPKHLCSWHWWIGHWPVNDVTYNVFGETLNFAQLLFPGPGAVEGN